MKAKLLLLALFVCGVVGARNPYVAVEGAIGDAAGIRISNPRTMLAVDVTVEHDRTLCGPYARYAQKYLGVRAPLSDKSVWSITGAKVALLDAQRLYLAAEPADSGMRVVSYGGEEGEFARLLPDKTDISTPSLEDAARAAAERIFSLRRHRLELITGEAGENVFGEGLHAALREIDRLEQAYLELFLGKRVISTSTRRYTVYPQAGKEQYILCRFSVESGLLPDSDLSGDIVLLKVEPSGTNPAAAIEASKKEKKVLRCRVADPSTCLVLCGGREYARTVLPLFEFGRTVLIPLTVER